MAEVPISGQGFGLNWQNRKIARQRGRKDGEITLHKAGREPRGRPAMAAPVSRAALHARCWGIVAAKGGDVHGRAPIRANRAWQVEHPPPVARAAPAHFASTYSTK